MATTYEVQLDGDITCTVQDAEYYKREEGWVTFKDAEHKVITDFPEGRIRLIARVRQDAHSIVIKAADISADDVAKMARRAGIHGRFSV